MNKKLKHTEILDYVNDQGRAIYFEMHYRIVTPVNLEDSGDAIKDGDDKYYWTKEHDGTLIWEWLINKGYMIRAQQFTMTEIEYYGLQDCEKEEVTDDGIR